MHDRITVTAATTAAEAVNLKLAQSFAIMKSAIETFDPTHIVSMVSGGKDSACSHAVAVELGIKVDKIVHGRTGCGIQSTTDYVINTYGGNLVVADTGTAYEEYVTRKGFFGKGISAHGFAYRILKATPFRKAISREIRKGKNGVRVLLVNGARKDESENRMKNLQVWRQDPAQKGNIWVNIIHDWTQDDRDYYLKSRNVPINPVAKKLCRSGECMCGTMQSFQDRAEASILYPEWGMWIDGLEEEARKKHGYGWGESFPKWKKTNENQCELFQPMCKDCLKNG